MKLLISKFNGSIEVVNANTYILTPRTLMLLDRFEANLFVITKTISLSGVKIIRTTNV